MSNKSDILRPSLSLSPPFLSALHSVLFICPSDATDMLSPDRKEHTRVRTHHRLRTTSAPAEVADSTRAAAAHCQRQQLSGTVTCFLKRSLNSVFSLLLWVV